MFSYMKNLDVCVCACVHECALLQGIPIMHACVYIIIGTMRREEAITKERRKIVEFTWNEVESRTVWGKGRDQQMGDEE